MAANLHHVDQGPPGPPPFLSSLEIERLFEQGHMALNLPEHLEEQLNRLFASSDQFFSLPEHDKSGAFPRRRRNVEHGYTHIQSEKEYVTAQYASWDPPRNAEKTTPPSVTTDFLSLMGDVWQGAAHLLYRILVDLSPALGIAPDAWDHLVEDSLYLPQSADEADQTLLRVFRYEPRGGQADQHRDLGLLTLCVCRGCGLEVWERLPPGYSPESSSTSSVTPPPEHDQGENNDGGTRSPPAQTPPWKAASRIVVMAGDTLRILSANKIPAANHRVVATDQGRSSIVFALRASTRRPLDLGRFNGEGVVDSLAFWNAIKARRFSVNAPKDVREKQKLALEHKTVQGIA
ncbi:hypothetical protein BX600DRAFT_56897 [Xylariales sp. PMI_506]|nr:hypothetical protein BX600DRAFT_56897 [Xylariales sp. PMI_506]